MYDQLCTQYVNLFSLQCRVVCHRIWVFYLKMSGTINTEVWPPRRDINSDIITHKNGVWWTHRVVLGPLLFYIYIKSWIRFISKINLYLVLFYEIKIRMLMTANTLSFKTLFYWISLHKLLWSLLNAAHTFVFYAFTPPWNSFINYPRNFISISQYCRDLFV